jgi:hypothetical protein
MDVGLTFRVEDLGGFGEGDVFAGQHLTEGGVVGDTEDGVGELEGEMEVADEPAEAGAFGGGGEGDFENGLGTLGDQISGGILKEDGAIAEGLGEVKAEFAAVFGSGVPAALCEGKTVDGEEDLGEAARRRGHRGADDVHWGKFEIRNQKFELLGARGARREWGDRRLRICFEFRISNFEFFPWVQV